jgi:radical SAM superfamily enzyme YgiQ (UPF0313 family)
MKITLINPLVREEWEPSQFPLGLGYIASSLLEEGHKVDVIDINVHRYNEKELVRLIKRIDSDAVGIGSVITRYAYMKNLIKMIKENNPNTKIIVGGPIATPIPEILLKNTETDVAVLGEGELTIKEVCDTIEEEKSLKGIKGIWFKDDKRIIQNQRRERIDNLDEISFPAWDIFPMDVYASTPITNNRFLRDMDIITSRGCPYQCTFCYTNLGKLVKFRSVDNVLEEIETLIDKYNIEYFSIFDENFLLNRRRVLEFCHKIKKERLGLNWSCAGRVNLVDEKLLKEMKKAGCNLINYGLESGSQKILDNMKKGFKVEQSEHAIKITKKAGMRISASFMIGMTGETIDTIKESIKFCKKNDVTGTFFFTTPLPGTELYENLKKKGKIEDEERYIESLGEMSNRIALNLTDFSDEKLRNLQKTVHKQIGISYMKKHPIKVILTGPVNFYHYANKFGLRKAIFRALFVAKRDLHLP